MEPGALTLTLRLRLSTRRKNGLAGESDCQPSDGPLRTSMEDNRDWMAWLLVSHRYRGRYMLGPCAADHVLDLLLPAVELAFAAVEHSSFLSFSGRIFSTGRGGRRGFSIIASAS